MPDTPEVAASPEDLERALLALDPVGVNRILLRPDAEVPPITRVERLVVPALQHIGIGLERGRFPTGAALGSHPCGALSSAPATGSIARPAN